MYTSVRESLLETLDEIRAAGLYKTERELGTPQSAHIATTGGPALNFCANNYLGLADHPDVVAAAHAGLDEWGFGMASVRFICGTQSQHRALERELAAFLGTDDAILYSSCFDANGGVFETLFGAEDAIISDELNHASIIDGVRLCKAARYRYRNADLADLEAQLQAASGAGAAGDRHRRRVLDGRLVRAAAGHLRPCRAARRPGVRGRLARRRLRRRRRSGHPGAVRRRRTGSTSSPAHSARPWAERPAVTWRPMPRSWSCCGSAPVRTCSPTRSRPAWWPARAKRCNGRGPRRGPRAAGRQRGPVPAS